MKTLLVFVPILVLIALLTIVITVFAKNKRRSIGVTLFSVWIVIQGISALEIRYTIGIFAYVIFGFFLAMAVGLIRLQNWARIAVLITYGLMNVWLAVNAFATFGQPEWNKNFATLCAALVYLGVIYFFLTRPKVKEQFKAMEYSNKETSLKN